MGVRGLREATARVPRQQTDDALVDADPSQRDIEQVAAWLLEAEDPSTRLSGQRSDGAWGSLPRPVSVESSTRCSISTSTWRTAHEAGRTHLRSVRS